MASRWPRLRRFLKWTFRGFLVLVVLLVGVYLLRDSLLAEPLGRLVGEQMSKALGGRFTLERVEGNYFTEIVVVGLRTQEEPPEGPLRRIDLERATVRFSLFRLLEDPVGALNAIEAKGVVVDLDLDRPTEPSEEPLEIADFLPRTFPTVDADARIRIRAGGQEFTIDRLAATGGGEAIELSIEGIDLAGEVQAKLLRLRVTHPEFGTFAVESQDSIAGVTPRRVAATIVGDFAAEAELGFADGTIAAAFNEAQATLKASDLSVDRLPEELRKRVPESIELPLTGVVAIDAEMARPLAEDREARAVVTVNRLRWTDWSVDLFEAKGAWRNGIALLESLDARIDDGFVRARNIELDPARKLPLTRLERVEANLPDLRVPLRRLGVVEHLPREPIAFRLEAHRAPGEPVRVDTLSLVAGPTRVTATGEFTLPADVDDWRTTPIRLTLDGVFDARTLRSPDVALTGAVTVQGSVGGTAGEPTAQLAVEGKNLSVDGRAIETLEAKGRLDWPRVDLDSLRFEAAAGSLLVKGAANLEARTLKDGSYEIDIRSLEELAKLIPGAPPMKGIVRGGGRIRGVSMEGEREGDANLLCENLEIDGVRIDSALVKASVRGDTVALSEFTVRAPKWNVAGAADATVSIEKKTVAARLTKLRAEALERTFELSAPLLLDWDGTTALVRELDASILGGRLRGSARYGDSIELQLEGTGIDAARLHADANGSLAFQVRANGTTVAPRWELTVYSSGLAFEQQSAKVDVRVRQDDRGVHVDSLEVDGIPRLRLAGSGFVPIEAGAEGVRILEGQPTLKLAAEVTPGGLAPYLPGTIRFSKATIDATLRGNSLDGVFRLRDLRWTEAPKDFIAGETVLQVRGRENGLDVILEGSELGPLLAKARVHSDAGLDWKTPEKLGARLLEAPLSGTASFTIPDLEPFTRLPGSPVAHGAGKGTIELTVGGTPQKPSVQGVLAIEASRMRLEGDLPTMQDVVARITFTEKQLVIERFEAQLGYAPLAIKGAITLPSEETTSTHVDLHIGGTNLLLSRTPYLRMRSDLDLSIKGPLEKLAATGAVTITNVLWSEPLKLLSNGGATAADDRLHLFHIRDEPLSRMEFDVAIKANETIRLDNNVVRGAVSADLKLRGTGEVPRLEGRVDFRDLQLTFPVTRERLKVERGSLVFPHDDPFRPVVRASCEARKLGHDLNVEVTGKVPDVEIVITSVPALPNDEAILLLTTGTTKERLKEGGEVQATMYIGRSILDAIMGPSDPDKESLIDRFEFESGRDVSEAGDPTMEARFRITEKWYVTAERDRWNEYNGGFMLRLRFR